MAYGYITNSFVINTMCNVLHFGLLTVRVHVRFHLSEKLCFADYFYFYRHTKLGIQIFGTIDRHHFFSFFFFFFFCYNFPLF